MSASACSFRIVTAQSFTVNRNVSWNLPRQVLLVVHILYEKLQSEVQNNSNSLIPKTVLHHHLLKFKYYNSENYFTFNHINVLLSGSAEF